MKTLVATVAAGLALFAATAASPALSAASAPSCTSGAACFFANDVPASPAEYGMPVRTGSIGRGWECQRWHEGPEERLLLLGGCSDDSEDRDSGRGAIDPN